MRVRDLGALMVVAGAGEQSVVGVRAAAVLALLSIHANQRVSVDALMQAVWGDRVSDGAASTLASHIWRLRQLLEPGRDRRQPPSVLVNDSDGYRLVCGPSTLDSLQLADAVTEVRDLVGAGHAATAVRRADAALVMWRGTPYGAFAEADWASTAVARLQELRRQLQERRMEALLATGDANAALSDLPTLIADTPYRESLRALHMEALYRTGRGEDALQAYQESRRVLLDDIGIEPGHELQRLHSRILQNDPTLVSAAPQPSTAPPRVEVHLPVPLTPLVGRADAVARLVGLLGPRKVVTLVGAAGCGKTRVAVEVARAAAPEFPDGVWFVDLTTVSEPDLVVDVIVSTVGFAASPGASALQDLRRYLQSRRLLLVLDNCEQVLDSVEFVVRATLGDPGATPECCLLITSREPVDIEGETIWSLEPLGLPDGGTGAAPAPAVELFLQRLASVRPELTVDEHVVARATDIAVALDGLPLPIELAAARALSHSLDDIAAQVAADPSRLARLGRGPVDHRATVRSAIEWSHRLLRADERRAHRRLSVLPGTFTSSSAAAVVGEEIGSLGIDDLLARLVHQSMLQSERERSIGGHTRFRQLTTVRSHAGHALTQAGEDTGSLDRRDGWTTALVADRPAFGTGAYAAWFQVIDQDYAAVRASLTRLLIDEPSPEGGRMAHRLTYYWYHRERLIEATGWLQRGLQALGERAPVDTLLTQIWLAAVHTVQRRLDLVLPRLGDLRAGVREVPPDRLLEVSDGLVTLALAAYICEDAGLLRAMDELVGWVVERVSDPNLALLAEAVHCCSLLLTGRLDEAVDLALSVHARAAEDDNPLATYVATAPLIAAALREVRPEDGILWIDRCVAAHAKFGSGSIGMFIETRANFTAQSGDYVRAARTYAASRTATQRAALVWPNRAWTRDLLARTRQNLSPGAFQQAWHEGETTALSDLVSG